MTRGAKRLLSERAGWLCNQDLIGFQVEEYGATSEVYEELLIDQAKESSRCEWGGWNSYRVPENNNFLSLILAPIVGQLNEDNTRPSVTPNTNDSFGFFHISFRFLSSYKHHPDLRTSHDVPSAQRQFSMSHVFVLIVGREHIVLCFILKVGSPNRWLRKG